MRIFLSLLVLIVISGCGNQDSEQQTTANQVSNETFKWKLVTSWPKNYPGLGSAPENFAKMVETMSNGRLQIKVCLLYTSPSPRDVEESRMPSSA